ncbi:MAG TPA: NADH-quinone oxidoreductase subunit J [Actinomycetota bacterium]|nr:NADH-quinone oxidoreductase subunit J [Actinomycetota bacterium]
MSLDVIVFGAIFVMTLGAGIAMLFARNAVHVALLLVLSQVGLAVAFLLQGAFFVAAIQIIIYAGAIMVLFLFVIMLLGVDRREALNEPLRGQRPLALGLGVLLTAQVLYVAWRGVDLTFAGAGEAAIQEVNAEPGNVLGIARVLFGRYLLPFEVTSVLLIVAVVGVMVLARRMTSPPKDDDLQRSGAEEEVAV